MSGTAILLILVSAFGHAGWNLLGKRQRPSAGFFFFANLAAALLMLPVVGYYHLVLPEIPLLVWGLLGVTGVFQAVYFIGLAGAYREGDLSLAYPLARAVPVILVAGVSVLVGRGYRIEPVGMMGMWLVALGCLVLPAASFKEFHLKNYWNLCCGLALVAALGTTGYTLIDDTALRELRALPELGLSNGQITLLFVGLEAVSIALMLGIYLLIQPNHALIELKYIVSNRSLWMSAGLAGLLMTAAYGLVLAAMAYVSDVSYVAAFRQLSIPLGAVLGIAVGKEPAPLPKTVGIAVMFAGLVLVAFR